MSRFRTISSSADIMSDVQSIYIPSSIQDWYWEDKFWAWKDRQYSLRLWIPWTKNTKILTRSTWKLRVLHNTCTKHGRNIKIRCLGRHQPCSEETIEVLSDTIERHHPLWSAPRFGEVIYEKVYASPRPPPKISLKHDWMKELGSEVARQPEGEVVQQSKSSQPTQPNPNPDHDRTVRPVVCPQWGAPGSRFLVTARTSI